MFACRMSCFQGMWGERARCVRWLRRGVSRYKHVIVVEGEIGEIVEEEEAEEDKAY